MNANGVFNAYNTTAPKDDSMKGLFSLKHKTAIVSGAGAGIGLQVARALAEQGANVAIWYNSNKKAEEKAEQIAEDFGVKCEFFATMAIAIAIVIVLLMFPAEQAKHTNAT